MLPLCHAQWADSARTSKSPKQLPLRHNWQVAQPRLVSLPNCSYPATPTGSLTQEQCPHKVVLTPPHLASGLSWDQGPSKVALELGRAALPHQHTHNSWVLQPAITRTRLPQSTLAVASAGHLSCAGGQPHPSASPQQSHPS